MEQPRVSEFLAVLPAADTYLRGPLRLLSYLALPRLPKMKGAEGWVPTSGSSNVGRVVRRAQQLGVPSVFFRLKLCSSVYRPVP